MSTTLKKIAELAGVSTGTVDRVINNRGRVNPAVESRIREIIQEVGYTPNLTAKSLALKRRSPKIGVIFHVKSTGFTDQVMKGITCAETEITDFGVEILTECSRSFDAENQLEIIEEMLSRDVNAIAITPINDPRIIARISQLLEQGFPVFCFINNIQTSLPHPFIGTDAYETGRIAAGLFRLLAGQNPERLMVITPSLKMLGHTQKIDGLRDTLREAAPNIELLDICEIHAGNDIEIYKTVHRYLTEHPQVSALWYATSFSDGGITALKEHDLLHKIKIVTLDLQHFIITGLQDGYISATISQNPYRQGYLAIKTIFNCLLQGNYARDMFEEVPCEILIRENNKLWQSRQH